MRRDSMMVARQKLRVGKRMAGRQTVTHCGLRFRVSPDFWLRRVLRFPFYFESANPSFRVDIKRVSEPGPDEYWELDQIILQIVFADGTETYRRYPVPNLKPGESTRLVLKEIYTAYPGQTIIRLPLDIGRGRTWETLYSYQVRTEEQLWLGVTGPLAGLVFGAGAAILGVAIDRALG